MGGRRQFNAFTIPITPIAPIAPITPKILIILMAFIIIAFPFRWLRAQVCPSWLHSDIESWPQCPLGASVVPETHPTLAVVISDAQYRNQGDPQFTQQLVAKVLNLSTTKPPIVVLPISEAKFTSVQRRVVSEPQLGSDMLSYLAWIPSAGFPWQQDYFESFIDFFGRPTLREVQSYRELRQVDVGVSEIVHKLSACGVTQAEDIVSSGGIGAHWGGNIEALPGGYCLLGDGDFSDHSQWLDFAQTTCGDASHKNILVPSYWLAVGHADEVFRVLKDRSQSSDSGIQTSGKCEMVVGVVSPRQAIKTLLEKGDDPFIAPDIDIGSTEIAAGDWGLEYICLKYVSQYRDWQNYFPLDEKFWQLCRQMTNQQAIELLEQDSEWSLFNDLIQLEMDHFKVRLSHQLSSQGCQISFVDLPTLYYSGRPEPVETRDRADGVRAARADDWAKDGAAANGPWPYERATLFKNNKLWRLPNELAVPILPPATGAVSIHGNLVISDPSNNQLRKYLLNQFSELHIQSDFINVLPFAQRSLGTLHCLTHTIHVCRP